MDNSRARVMDGLQGSIQTVARRLFAGLLCCCTALLPAAAAPVAPVAPTNAPFSLAFYAEGRMQVAHSSALNPPDQLTVEAWVKPAQISGVQILVDRSEAAGRRRPGGYQLSLQDGRLSFTTCTTAAAAAGPVCPTVTVAAPLQAGVWQHVAGVFSGAGAAVFVNGQPQGALQMQPAAIAAVSGAMTVGAGHGGANRFNGLLDEIRVSRTAAYTAAFVPAAQAANGPLVMGLWRFDGGNVNDLSAHAHATSTIGSVTFSTDVPSGFATAQFVRTDTPNVGPKNRLNDVVTVAADRAWAVGFHGPASTCCFPATPVALRWNGSQWIDEPVPYPPGYQQGQLVSVAAAPGALTAWALGTLRPGTSGGSDSGWLLQWDGKRWNTVAVFSDPRYDGPEIGTVKSLAVVSDDEVWIVGSRIGGRSWTLRWDGSRLQTIPSPNVDTGGNGLFDIAVAGPNQLYAVGSFMAIRWDGTQWSVVADGSGLLRNLHLRAVSAVSGNAVWIVGRGTACGPFEGCSSADRVLRYDGATASTVAVEPFTQGQVILEGVSASGPGDVWVVGTADNKGLVLHLEGGVFRRKQTEPSPPSTIDYDWLFSVSALSPSLVFGVGIAIDVFYDPYRSTDSTHALRGVP